MYLLYLYTYRYLNAYTYMNTYICIYIDCFYLCILYMRVSIYEYVYLYVYRYRFMYICLYHISNTTYVCMCLCIVQMDHNTAVDQNASPNTAVGYANPAMLRGPVYCAMASNHAPAHGG